MSYFLHVLFFLFVSFSVNSQTLKTELFELNPGGVIYDVAFDVHKNAFVVVGDFYSINGDLKKNIAYIDATTQTVLNYSPITDIDGPIRTVAFYSEFVPLSNKTDYLYLGGEFTQVNSTTKIGVCRFRANESFLFPFITTDYSLNAWDADIPNTGNVVVNDFSIKGDTIAMVGNFQLYTGTTSYATVDMENIAAYNITGSGAAFNTVFQSFGNTFPLEIYKIQNFDNEFYVDGYRKFNASGTLIGNYTGCGAASSWDFNVNATLADTLLIGWKVYSGTNDGYMVQSADGSMLNCPFNQVVPPIFLNSGGGLATGFVESYNNGVYFADNNRIDVFRRDGITPSNPVDTIVLNNNWYSFAAGWRPQKHKIVRNRMFVSGDQLTTVDGQPRTGLAVFCLEPKNPEDFTAFDATICEGNLKTYTIPQSEFAEGYRWTYTGTGATFRVAGTMNVFKPLTDSIVANLTANSIEIQFGIGTTAGTLSVFPFSTCNSSTDYLFSKSKSLSLITAALPNLTLVEDSMSFNCVRDSFFLIGQSTTPGITWNWTYNGGALGTNDSVYVHVDSNIIDLSYHYVQVLEPINQCVSTDSVLIYYDLAPPVVSANDIIATPPVFDCTTSSLSLDVILPNTSVAWDIFPSLENPSLSNYTIYNTNDSLIVYAYVTSTINGCVATQQYVIPVDDTSLVGTILGYPNFGSVLILDSLNCTSSLLNLQSSFASGNGTSEWIIGGVPSGDQLNLASADSAGMNAFNTNSYQFITTNNDNGCVDTSNVTIKFDFEIPYLNTYSGLSSLNCSAVDLELVHQTSGGNVLEGWLDDFGVQTFNDSLLITVVGDYYYQVEDADNGCVNTDTVEVLQTLEMYVDLPNDTTICNGQSIDVTPVSVNNTEQTTYDWSTGETTQTISLIGGVDSLVTLIATTISGCTAYDTILIDVNPDVDAEILASVGCSDGALQITNTTGGAGPYEYSLDETNWQLDEVFTGLSFGPHTIYIRDDLGCIYSFIETIDGSAAQLDVNFLVSTYNEEGDTLAIVNISNFTGFDSLVWVVPNSASVYSIDDSMVVLSIVNGGWYDVTLIGYQDTCAYSFTKSVYFGEESPVFGNDHALVGIESVLISPNPTSDNFSVAVEFGQLQNYTIVVTNMFGQPIPSMSSSGAAESVLDSFVFPASSPAGSYRVHIISDFDAQQETIILQ